jgi:hypothetical protein
LRPDNPRLLDLKKRYAKVSADATSPLAWDEGHLSAEDLQWFRGDNAYVWQLRGRNMNVLGYALTALYIKAIDTRGLLDRLSEDGAFGAHTFEVCGKTVSRDLLDSVNEIHFLDRQLGIAERTGLHVLDVGAGYGRLAHRMLTALPGISAYDCADAVASSTFICDYYLQFRDLGARARSVPLDEVESALAIRPVDLAVNIHSFSECTLAAVDWWVSRLSRYRVPHLMIVPNPVDRTAGASLHNNEHQDMHPVIERHGYRLIASEPKYADPTVQDYGIDPTHYYLFELRS